MVAKKYNAFISYRHSGMDEIVAKRLHTLIENYYIPQSLKKSLGYNKMGRVFRDQEELPLSNDLGQDIHNALDNSEWLICICSPRYNESRWCMEELDYFIRSGKRDHILTVLIDGDPAESFPKVLLKDENGNDIEPLAADVRADSKTRVLEKLKKEKLRILAPMLGVTFDDLRQRFKQRRNKIIIAVSAILIAVLSVLSAYVIYKNSQVSRERNSALASQSKYLSKEVDTLLREGSDRILAILLAKEALPEDIDNPDRPVTKEAIYALRNALTANMDALYSPKADLPMRVMAVQGADNKLAICSDTNTELLSEYNLDDGRQTAFPLILSVKPYQIQFVPGLITVYYTDSFGIHRVRIDGEKANDTLVYANEYLSKIDPKMSVGINSEQFVFSRGYAVVSNPVGTDAECNILEEEIYSNNMKTRLSVTSPVMFCGNELGGETYPDGLFLINLLNGEDEALVLLNNQKTDGSLYSAVVRKYYSPSEQTVKYDSSATEFHSDVATEYISSYDGKYVLAASTDYLNVWYADSTELKASLSYKQLDSRVIEHITVAKNSPIAAILTSSGNLFKFDYETGEIKQLNTDRQRIRSVHFNSDDTKLLCTDIEAGKVYVISAEGSTIQSIDVNFEIEEAEFTHHDSFGNANEDKYFIVRGTDKARIYVENSDLNRETFSIVNGDITGARFSKMNQNGTEIWCLTADYYDTRIATLTAYNIETGEDTIIRSGDVLELAGMHYITKIGHDKMAYSGKIFDGQKTFKSTIEIYDANTHDLIKSITPSHTFVNDDRENISLSDDALMAVYADDKYTIFVGDNNGYPLYVLDNDKLEIVYSGRSEGDLKGCEFEGNHFLRKSRLNSKGSFCVVNTDSWEDEIVINRFPVDQVCDVIVDAEVPGFSDMIGIYLYSNQTYIVDLRNDNEKVIDLPSTIRACLSKDKKSIILKTESYGGSYYIFDGESAKVYEASDEEKAKLSNEKLIFRFGNAYAYQDKSVIYEADSSERILDFYNDNLQVISDCEDGSSILVHDITNTKKLYLCRYVEEKRLLNIASYYLNGRELSAEEKAKYYIEE